MRSTTPIDDKQLWRIVDSIEGREYSWPIYATPSVEYQDKRCYVVEPALPVENEAQWKFVCDRLQPLAFDTDGRRWLLRQSVLEKIAVKCAGVTPSYYVKWNEVKRNETQTHNTQPPETSSNLADDFVHYTCAEIGFTNVPVARLLYTAFCQMALKWMLEKHQPLKMGFCTLHLLPYRQNWQGILHAQWPNILSTFRKPARSELLEAIGFTESLHAPELAEMQTENAFGWSITAVHEPPFEETVKQMEVATLNAADKPVKYLNRWSNLIAKNYETIYSVFAAYLEKAARPFGYVDLTVKKDQWRMVQKTSRGSVRPITHRPPATHLTTAPHTPDEPSSAVVAVEETAENLPTVPNV